MNCNNVSELYGLVIFNMNKNAKRGDSWSAADGSYGFYTANYESPLEVGHWYYHRFTYKFTTTNQSPTWCYFYHQGGYRRCAGMSNPVAGYEYTMSGIYQPDPSYELSYGTIYNGNSDAIKGVLAQAKNVLTYDITALRLALLAQGIVDIQNWCDIHLAFVPFMEPLYVCPMIHSKTAYPDSYNIDYCTRDSTVAWSQSDIKETFSIYNHPAGGTTLLSIPSSNSGNHFLSYQTVVSDSSLLPKKYYWVSSSPGINGFPVYTSSAIYNTSQCTDYSNRMGNVGWNDGEILETKDDEEWATGKTILLACRCNNGNTYYSYQSVASRTALTPQHKYLILPENAIIKYNINVDNLNSIKIKQGEVLTDSVKEGNANKISKGNLELKSISEGNMTSIKI